MPLFSKDGKTLLFLHIPKTGGTSVTFFFKANRFSVSWASSSFDARLGKSSPQHRDRYTVLHFLTKERIRYDACFTVVRNPLDRLLSEYFQQCRNRDALSIKLTRRGLFHRPLTSRGFSYWTEKAFELSVANPVKFDNHLRPQVDFILDDAKVLRFENRFSDFRRYVLDLDSTHGFGLDLTRLRHYNPSGNRVELTVDRKTLQRVRDFYRDDYERFYPEGDPSFEPAASTVPSVGFRKAPPRGFLDFAFDRKNPYR